MPHCYGKNQPRAGRPTMALSMPRIACIKKIELFVIPCLATAMDRLGGALTFLHSVDVTDHRVMPAEFMPPHY